MNMKESFLLSRHEELKGESFQALLTDHFRAGVFRRAESRGRAEQLRRVLRVESL